MCSYAAEKNPVEGRKVTRGVGQMSTGLMMYF
jgi:hypothetical protein